MLIEELYDALIEAGASEGASGCKGNDELRNANLEDRE
jgi:hypothetical protein